MILVSVSCSNRKFVAPSIAPSDSAMNRGRAVVPPPRNVIPVPVINEKFDPPPKDFALIPNKDYCPTGSGLNTPGTPACFPHSPYGAWIGTAECLPEVSVDMVGVPRPNRPPNTLFVGDTGCDIGAYQYNGPEPPVKLRKVN